MSEPDRSVDACRAPVQAESGYHVYMASVAMLAILVGSALLIAPRLPDVVGVLLIVDFVICLLFAFDFSRSFWKAKSKTRYMVTWGWIDLVTCIPFVAEARWLRLARLLRIFTIVRAVRILWTSSRADRRSVVMAGATFVVQTAFVVLCVLVLYFEHDAPGGNIRTASDVMWWGICTVTTVGYGDRFPVTDGGRICGAILMLSGIGYLTTVLGVVTRITQPFSRKS
jgi:voltage-gated potassium channel